MQLEGKTILVTGTTAGFGQAMVERFIAEGARVVAAARNPQKLARQAEAYDAAAFLPLHMDVTDREGVFAAIASLPGPWRALDALVNNAGLALGLDTADKADLDEWETMVATNINGVMYCTRAVLPDMVERNRGHIVNIGSISGTYAYPGGNVYGGTKAFVEQFSLNLRTDLLGTRVRVTTIEPGMAETDFSLTRFSGDAARAAEIYAGTEPLRAQDIAECVAWVLAQPEHVNVNRLEVMPTYQAPGGVKVHRAG